MEFWIDGGANSLTQWYCPALVGALARNVRCCSSLVGSKDCIHGCHFRHGGDDRNLEDPGDDVHPDGSLTTVNFRNDKLLYAFVLTPRPPLINENEDDTISPIQVPMMMHVRPNVEIVWKFLW